MVVLVGVTAVVQWGMKGMYEPLVEFLPLSLANRGVTGGVDEGDAEVEAEADGANGAGANAYEMDHKAARRAPGTGANEKPGQHNSEDSLIDNSPDPDGHFSPTSRAANRSAGEQSAFTPSPHSHDFTHPAIHSPPAILWLPHDLLNFAPGEVRACRACGIDASADAQLAEMDGRGKVHVVEGAVPPGEEGGGDF